MVYSVEPRALTCPFKQVIWLLGHFWVDTPHRNTFEGDTVFKMALLEAPTGTLLFYYKDIEQEIVHTLLLEEYGV